MDALDAWNNFLSTGSVMDYLAYTSIHDAELSDAEKQENELSEDEYESEYGRSDHKGTKYW